MGQPIDDLETKQALSNEKMIPAAQIFRKNLELVNIGLSLVLKECAIHSTCQGRGGGFVLGGRTYQVMVILYTQKEVAFSV